MRRKQITLALVLAGSISWVGLTSWRAHLKTLATGTQSVSAELIAPMAAPSMLPSQSALKTQPATQAHHISQVQLASVSGKVDLKELEFKMPDRETYHAQVTEQEKQEGAGIPPVLREFSIRMAELMEKASQSPPFAAALFDRLKECAGAKRGETIHQARTICAVNAIRLGEIHPRTLGIQAKAFRESLPARLKTRVVALGF